MLAIRWRGVFWLGCGLLLTGSLAVFLAKPSAGASGFDEPEPVSLAVPDGDAIFDSPQQRGARGGRGNQGRGVYRAAIDPHWFANNTRFWYRNDLRGGTREFILVDAEAGTRLPAFDHARLAAALSTRLDRALTANLLPFDEITFSDDLSSLKFTVDGSVWSCLFNDYSLQALGAPVAAADQRNARNDGSLPTEIHLDVDADVAFADLETVGAGELSEDWEREQSPQQGAGRRGAQRGRAGGGRGRGGRSPDQSWLAEVRDGNVFLRLEAENREVQLTNGGTPEIPYGSLEWSPDSQSLVAFRTEPGDRLEAHLLESSPASGGRAVLRSRPYPLPGDKFTRYEPHLFSAASGQEIPTQLDAIDFGRPQLNWDEDRRHFWYQQVDRGHQRLRVIRVDAQTGESVNVIDERTDTFIWTAHTENVSVPILTWLPRTREFIYASERDGWRHLYLVDGERGGIKTQITRGEFVVRGVDRVDEDSRQIWFQASGGFKDQDPYLLHHYRVDFSGENLVSLTAGHGHHTVRYSPDRRFLVDTYSRVDMPPVNELRRASDGGLVCELERADITELQAAGWAPPEVFVAKGRDDQTDIWGIICRPRNYDPARKYPVLESIYAGPQGAYVPKSFNAQRRFAELTDLGFVVVQMDGMGTANRSKAFHDVCWHDLGDAGFPDRIKWIRAAAAKDPGMDLERVGLYGSSAGGQNAAGGLLFHPEFYKVGAAGCGCHDNRMDKASWNEQWMGYPVGPQYSKSSNIDNAAKLQGKLLLIVGELDDNVPPESTLRFADALIKADKDFDLLVVPGAGHGWGGAYGSRKMREFFVEHLLGEETTNRNSRRGRGGRAGRGAAQNAAGAQGVAFQPPNGEQGAVVDGESLPSRVLPAPVVDLSGLAPRPAGMESVWNRYRADRGNLTQFYVVPDSPRTAQRMREFQTEWLTRVSSLSADQFTPQDRTRQTELIAEISTALAGIERSQLEWERIAKLLPFRETIVRLAEQRQAVATIDPKAVAGDVAALAVQVKAMQQRIAARRNLAEFQLPGAEFRRAGLVVSDLRGHLTRWFAFYDGYDPLFSWWLKSPQADAVAALEGLAAALKEVTDADVPVGLERAESSVRHEVAGAQVPNLLELAQEPRGVMPEVLARYQASSGGARGGRGRRGGPAGRGEVLQPEGENQRGPAPRATPSDWIDALQTMEFGGLSRSDQVDYLLLQNELRYSLSGAGRGGGRRGASLPVDDSGIRGNPIGREALLRELGHELIPYTPEELIEIAEIEYAWCAAELLRASREMGFGDDWRAAVEKVKSMHVDPGKQPELIRDLAWEAIAYLEDNDLLTLPPIAAETWRMQMMSPERQLVNPFFTGGASITVSFPTDTMSHDAKLQSLRGNNIPFARATVHHELIPGHNLQQYMNARYSTHRRQFSTPFWGEGWALYWELLLYDRGFPKTPEDRVGFLVWRSHRCARIIFSLSFHLGLMTPQECIDFLVAKVGFDRNNSAAEVKRSFEQAEPLYQAAYLLGGLQFWGLRQELVGSGKMTDREFHDRILREGSMLVRMVRAALTSEPLSREGVTNWRFHVPPK